LLAKGKIETLLLKNIMLGLRTKKVKVCYRDWLNLNESVLLEKTVFVE